MKWMTTMADNLPYINFLTSFKEFKHSVKFHLAMAGGPSAALCMYMLKSVDIIDSLSNNAIGKADEEAMLVANEIVKSVAENVRDAIDKYASEGQLSNLQNDKVNSIILHVLLSSRLQH